MYQGSTQYSTVEEIEKQYTGFIMQNDVKSAILNFKAINETICMLRVRQGFFVTDHTPIYTYTPIEDAQEMRKMVIITS